MTDLTPMEQALQDRMTEAAAYALELTKLDGDRARAFLASGPSTANLRRRSDELLSVGAAAGRTSYLERAMRSAEAAIDDAARLGLVPEGDPAADEAPSCWGLDGDDWSRLVGVVRVHAGTMIVGDILEHGRC